MWSSRRGPCQARSVWPSRHARASSSHISGRCLIFDIFWKFLVLFNLVLMCAPSITRVSMCVSVHACVCVCDTHVAGGRVGQAHVISQLGIPIVYES